MTSRPDLPPVIGHRGAAGLEHENTLAGVRRASVLGVRWVEFDVRLTADGVPVVCHDAALARTMGGAEGLIHETTWARLQTLDAGDGLPPPRLVDFLEEAQTHNLGVDIELKGDAGEPERLASVALAVVRAVWTSPILPLITSFDIPCLEVAHAEAPEWPRGLLMERLSPGWRDLARRLDLAVLGLHHGALTRARTEILSRWGLPILAYTVNDGARARELWRWGVAALATDRPDLMIPT